MNYPLLLKLSCFTAFMLSGCNQISKNENIGDSTDNKGVFNFGVVNVILTYPSDYLPEMDVTLLNLDSHEKIGKRSTMNVSKLRFENVPVGRYVIYAVTRENLVYQEKGLGLPDPDAPLVPAEGGYTQSENDFDLKPFSVDDNSSVTVEINDWDVSIPL